jgi:hypothetical protein
MQASSKEGSSKVKARMVEAQRSKLNAERPKESLQ